MATRVIRVICWTALAVRTSAAAGTELLHVTARPGSEAAGLNISHPDLPGNTFERGGPEEVHRRTQSLIEHSRRQPDVRSP